MIQTAVEQMYAESEENRFLEVTYANSDEEVLYFKDFNSGAMIENIVGRAKKGRDQGMPRADQKGLRVSHLLQACVDEFKENEDLPTPPTRSDSGPNLRKEGRTDRLHPYARIQLESRARTPDAPSTRWRTPGSTC